MNTDQRWEYLLSLDDKYLLGGSMLSEWTAFLVRDSDTAVCNGANLAAILAAQASIECHLRYEYSSYHSGTRLGFYDLIEQSPLEASLKDDLHKLRRFRNKWVHVNNPHEDSDLLAQPEANQLELESVALDTMDLLRRVLYLEQSL